MNTVKKLFNSVVRFVKEVNDIIINDNSHNTSESIIELKEEEEYKSAFDKVVQSDKIGALAELVNELQLDEYVNTDIVIKDYEVHICGINFHDLSGNEDVKDFYLVDDNNPVYSDDLSEVTKVNVLLKYKQKQLDILRKGVKELAKELEVDEYIVWEALEE